MEVWCGILEISSDNKEKIIGLSRAGLFFNEILGYIDKYLELENKYKTIETATDDAVSKIEEPGLYLLNMGNIIRLVNREKKVSVGYIYNSTYFETITLYTWRTVCFENVLRMIKPVPEPAVIEPEKNTEEKLEEQPVEEENQADEDESIPPFNFSVVESNGSFLLVCRDPDTRKNVLNFLVNNLGISAENYRNMLIVSSDNLEDKDYYTQFTGAATCRKYNKDTIANFSHLENGCIIFDGCMSRKSMRQLAQSRVNFDVPYIMVVDDLDNLRGNFWPIFKYILLTEDTKNEDRDTVWNRFAVSFPDKEEFDKLYYECTANYGAMVIYNVRQ